MKKLTQEEFICRVKCLHGDVIDFSNFEYVNVNSKIKYYCKNGHFNNRKANLLLTTKTYCKQCSVMDSFKNFLEIAKSIHGNDKYDYSKVKYIDAKINVEILCKYHGSFFATPDNHIRMKSGCPKCSNNKRLTTDEFIEIAKSIHGNDKYDYSKVKYINSHTKVVLVCNKHGEFKITPNSHISGSRCGCRKCGSEKLSNDRRFDVSQFLKNAISKHGSDKYDYSEVEYINANTKIKIFCNKCKKYFYQIPNSHIRSGCRKCSESLTGDRFRLTCDEFISKSKMIHGSDKYDYSKVKYVGYNVKITLICKLHNEEFDITPNSHFNSHKGCKYCKRVKSKGENRIQNYFVENDIKFEPQFRFDDCRSKYPLPFDFGVLNDDGSLFCLCEFHGAQHYKVVKFPKMTTEQAEKNFEGVVFRDSIKKEYCEKNQIKILYISYKQLDEIEEILSEYLKLNSH